MNQTLHAKHPDGAPHRISLSRGIAYTYLSNLAYVGAQWCLLLIMARYGNAALVGNYVFCLAVVSPVFMLTSQRLRSLQATDVNRGYLFGHYLAVSLIGNGLALVVTGALALLTASTAETRLLMLLLGAVKSLEAVTEVCYGWLQQSGRLDLLAVSRTLHGLVQFIVFSASFYATGSIVWSIGAMALARGTAGLAVDVVLMLRCRRSRTGETGRVPVFREIAGCHRPIFDWAALWSLTCVATPLGVTVLLMSLLNNCPKYFLAQFTNDTQLGVFGVFAALLTAGATVTRAVNQASCTRLAQLHVAGRSTQFRKLVSSILFFYVSMCGVAAFLAWLQGERALHVVLGSEFAPYWRVLVVVILSGAVNYSAGLVDTALVAVRCTKLLPRLVLVSGGLMLLWCTILIPPFGLYGAAASLGLAKLPFVAYGLLTLYAVAGAGTVAGSEKPEWEAGSRSLMPGHLRRTDVQPERPRPNPGQVLTLDDRTVGNGMPHPLK